MHCPLACHQTGLGSPKSEQSHTCGRLLLTSSVLLSLSLMPGLRSPWGFGGLGSTPELHGLFQGGAGESSGMCRSDCGQGSQSEHCKDVRVTGVFCLSVCNWVCVHTAVVAVSAGMFPCGLGDCVCVCVGVCVCFSVSHCPGGKVLLVSESWLCPALQVSYPVSLESRGV